MEFYEQQINLVRGDGVTVPARRFIADGELAEKRNGAGIVVVAGERGLGNEVIERFVKPFVELGYHVLATDVVNGHTTESDSVAQERAKALDADGAVEEIAAALLSLREVASGKLGLIGLDAAASVAVRAATRLPQIDAVVHAGGAFPLEAQLTRMRAHVQLHRPREGGAIDNATCDAAREGLRRAGAQFFTYEYDVADGFALRPRNAEETEQAGIVWTRARDFFNWALR
jgi:dienelactone hydrolase